MGTQPLPLVLWHSTAQELVHTHSCAYTHTGRNGHGQEVSAGLTLLQGGPHVHPDSNTSRGTETLLNSQLIFSARVLLFSFFPLNPYPTSNSINKHTVSLELHQPLRGRYTTLTPFLEDFEVTGQDTGVGVGCR